MATTQGSAEDGMSHISVLHTHTKDPLTLAVPPGARVADLKTAIAERCPGQPRPNGQRIIWKGRIVVDEEVVGDVWKPGHDTHTVHLAVHPSAWSEPPDDPPSAPLPPMPTVALPLPTQATIAKDLVMFHHANALRAMAGQPLEPWHYPWGLDQASAAHWAFTGLSAAGHTFPTILLSPYPPHATSEPGLEYNFITIDNRPYLELANPDASPTPVQYHAIQVLTSTLALLPYLDDLTPPPPSLQTAYQPPPRPTTQATIQRVRRLVVALRTLVPLSFTLLRASLFIVFFPQAREPLWLTVIIGIVLYEARIIINRANEAIPNIPDPNRNPAPDPNQTSLLSMSLNAILDRATLSGVDSEAALLDLDMPERELRPPPRDAAEENKARERLVRARSFVLLLGVTLVPAAWTRRREALRLREGRVRVVYGERANSLRVENEEGQEAVGMLGERRIEALQPGGWRRTYVERVLGGIEEHVE